MKPNLFLTILLSLALNVLDLASDRACLADSRSLSATTGTRTRIQMWSVALSLLLSPPDHSSSSTIGFMDMWAVGSTRVLGMWAAGRTRVLVDARLVMATWLDMRLIMKSLVLDHLLKPLHRSLG